MREYIKIQQPLIILPVDEFTGAVIIDQSFKIWIDGAGIPIRKPDGFHVFMRLNNMEVIVRLQGTGYQDQVLKIDRSQLDYRNPLVKIRMKPDHSYLFPPDVFYIQGTLPNEAVLTVAGRKGGTFRKLLSDVSQGDGDIGIYQKQEENLEGTIYYALETKGLDPGSEALGDKDEKGEWIELLWMENSIYRLKNPVKREYRKKYTRLYPAVRQYAEGMRTPYFIAVRGKRNEAYMQVVCCLDTHEGIREYEYELAAGKTLFLDF